MSDEPKNWNDALGKSDLTMSMFANKDDLIRALRAENERLREALAKIDVGEGWAEMNARAARNVRNEKGPGD